MNLITTGVLLLVAVYIGATVLDQTKGQPRDSGGRYQTWRQNQVIELISLSLAAVFIIWVIA